MQTNDFYCSDNSSIQQTPTQKSSLMLWGLYAASVVLALLNLPEISAETAVCSPPRDGEPMFITPACVDPVLQEAVVDLDEWRDTPVRHRYVNGHFADTNSRFSFYFPPAEQYERRFFQTTHQLLTSENTAPDNIAFGVASGAYIVQSVPGPNEAIRSTAQVAAGIDPALAGYRVNAAAAKYSRMVAAEMYGDHRAYGYIYGGSGGAYQVIAAMQNSDGVWDGGLPYVMGTPHAIPNLFTARIHALRVLKGKFPQIMDAIEPGGSGDIYAGLDDEERSALGEATRMGFPPRGWFDYPTMNGGPLVLVAGYVPMLDPGYVEDFWSKPGYLGTDTNSSVADARITHVAKVVNVSTQPPMRIELSSVPEGDLTGADLVITSGASAGKSVPLSSAAGGLGLGVNPGQNVPLSEENQNAVGVGFGANPAVIAGIAPGDEVRIDNSLYLALQTYHRHQVPTPDLYGWNQFRNADGAPMYPQRAVLIGPNAAFNGAGSISSGDFNGKMIVMQNLMDIDALPWQADWYRTKVREAGRAADFRLYYTDRADHIGFPTGVRGAQLVPYQGALQQLLRDLSAWVERGIEPPAATNYEVVDTQIVVPPRAANRHGIQPVVVLRANGGERAEVAVGEPVTFTAHVEVPPGTGQVVAAEWDFEGQGAFPVSTASDELGKESVDLNVTHTFTTPGTYFAVLRVSSQREGDRDTPFRQVRNLDRVRVVVK